MLNELELLKEAAVLSEVLRAESEKLSDNELLSDIELAWLNELLADCEAALELLTDVEADVLVASDSLSACD